MSAWKNSALRRRVARAEYVLEQRRFRLDADWSRLKRDGRQALTPGRIVVAGLVLGFLFGRAAPLANLAGAARLLRLTTGFVGLINTAMATFAAAQAEEAADEAADADAEDAAESVADQAPDAAETAAAETDGAVEDTAAAGEAVAPARAVPTTKTGEPLR